MVVDVAAASRDGEGAETGSASHPARNGLREADLLQGHQQAWLLLTDQGQPGRRRAERQPVLEDGGSHLGQ